mmetsp:Transcript_36759/g.104577  ORF Transcript_36759/g.104577 Transcript_36759/m.104577 type:complete len:370 (-) Transcript_36759:272-1381(-)
MTTLRFFNGTFWPSGPFMVLYEKYSEASDGSKSSSWLAFSCAAADLLTGPCEEARATWGLDAMPTIDNPMPSATVEEEAPPPPALFGAGASLFARLRFFFVPTSSPALRPRSSPSRPSCVWRAAAPSKLCVRCAAREAHVGKPCTSSASVTSPASVCVPSASVPSGQKGAGFFANLPLKRCFEMRSLAASTGARSAAVGAVLAKTPSWSSCAAGADGCGNRGTPGLFGAFGASSTTSLVPFLFFLFFFFFFFFSPRLPLASRVAEIRGVCSRVGLFLPRLPFRGFTWTPGSEIGDTLRMSSLISLPPINNSRVVRCVRKVRSVGAMPLAAMLRPAMLTPPMLLPAMLRPAMLMPATVLPATLLPGALLE